MTKTIATIAIDHADYPPGHPGRPRQQRSIIRNFQMCPRNFRFQVGRVGKPETKSLIQWPRSGRPTHSEKSVPFVADMLNWATSQETIFGGFINSDIVIHPSFYQRVIDAESTSAACILIHRTDVSEGEFERLLASETPEALELGTKVDPSRSIDGVLFRAWRWREFKRNYPDFVAGEPFWDTAMLHIIERENNDFDVHMTENVALHVRHVASWGWQTVGGIVGRKLYHEVLEAK